MRSGFVRDVTASGRELHPALERDVGPAPAIEHAILANRGGVPKPLEVPLVHGLPLESGGSTAVVQRVAMLAIHIGQGDVHAQAIADARAALGDPRPGARVELHLAVEESWLREDLRKGHLMTALP